VGVSATEILFTILMGCKKDTNKQAGHVSLF
jgi:hypothetical protein